MLKAYVRYIGGLGPAKDDTVLAQLSYYAGAPWKDESLTVDDFRSGWNRPGL